MMEEKYKHLEIIQQNIGRMNNCSFQIKGWCVAIVAALLAVYATTVDYYGNHNVKLLYITVLPIITFWLLDSFYLAKEKDLITIYNIVAGLQESTTGIKCFEISPSLQGKEKASYIKVLFSKTEWTFYLALTVLVGLICLISR